MSKSLNQPMKRYMPGLDGLRAFSVIAVIAYHLQLKWAQGGLLGVEVFFVLSGYLITDQILMEWSTHRRLSIIQFWIRRIRRLVPAMVVMLLLVALWLVLTDIDRLQLLRGDFLSSLLYVNNWYLIFHQVSYFDSFGPASPIGHLWSLAIEEQFYVIWPILLLFLVSAVLRRGKLMISILIGATLSVIAMTVLYEPGTDPSRVYYGTDTRAFALLIGAALAAIWPSWKLKPTISTFARKLLDISGTVGLIILFILVYRVNEFDDWLYPWGFLLLSIVTIIVIAVLVHPATRLDRIIGGKLLTWIGKRSYSLYIWHYPIIILSTPVVDTEGASMMRIIGQLLTTILISSLSYRYIEEPFRRGTFHIRPMKILRSQTAQVFHKYEQSILIVCMVAAIWMLASWGGHSLAPEQSTSAVIPAPALKIASANSADYSTATALNAEDENIFTNPNDSTLPSMNNVQSHSITAIGDSILLDAKPYLEKEMPGIVIDGKVGRQMSEAPAVLTQLKQQGVLGDKVIIELGTNGVFNMTQVQALLASLSDRQIYLVNTRVPRGWQGSVNNNIRRLTDQFHYVHLIDWYAASEHQDDWFYTDGVHLKPDGAKSLVALIRTAIDTTEITDK